MGDVIWGIRFGDTAEIKQIWRLARAMGPVGGWSQPNPFTLEMETLPDGTVAVKPSRFAGNYAKALEQAAQSALGN